MKKHVLSLMLALVSISSMAAQPGQCGPGFRAWDLNCDGKVSGDEAHASMQDYHDYNNSIHIPAHRQGLLPPGEAGYPERVPEATDNRKWVNVLHERVNNRTYRNTTGKPIIVAVTPSGKRWESMKTYLDNVQFGRVFSGDFGGGGTVTMEVPVNSTYRVRIWNDRGHPYAFESWLEFRE